MGRIYGQNVCIECMGNNVQNVSMGRIYTRIGRTYIYEQKVWVECMGRTYRQNVWVERSGRMYGVEYMS